MYISKRTKYGAVFALVSLLVFISMAMTLAYIYDKEQNYYYPFALDRFATEYSWTKIDNPVNTSALSDLFTSETLTILSIENSKTVVGLFDGGMYYYPMINMAVIGMNRYFGEEDYVNMKNVGILIIEYLSADSQVETDFEPLFYIDKNNHFYRYFEEFDGILNLTSLEFLGDTIYIRSEDENERSKIDQALDKLGYKKQEKKDAFISAWLKGIRSKFRVAALFFSSLGLYLLLFLSSFFYFYLNNRDLTIHYYCGGRSIHTFWIFYHQIFYLSIIFQFFSYFFLLKQQKLGHIPMVFQLKEFVIFSIVHTIAVIGIFFTTYTIYQVRE